jgi:ubiquinone/menaquinone biosynthesis C-methylase UbiE
MMSVFKQALGQIAGGRVLDVATGRGSFVGTLERSLQSYTEIVGIDVDDRFLKAAQSSYGEGRIRFIQMDAERQGFQDGSFDTVGAAKSLHHWIDVPQVLGEMKRVLKPGGRLVVCDMHQDVQTEAQRTDMDIHHLGADVHSLRGFTHNRTFRRQEIVDLVEGLGLSNIVSYDWSDTASDPMNAEAVREKEALIDRILQDAEDVPNYGALRQRGEQLRQRLHDTGIQSEPVVVVVGQKA